MDNIPSVLEILSCAVLFVVACLGMYHSAYDDTPTQRIGLGLIAAFSAMLILGGIMGMRTSPALQGVVAGCAVFAWGCLLKHRRIWLCDRCQIPPSQPS